jgi:hypothetical protein
MPATPMRLTKVPRAFKAGTPFQSGAQPLRYRPVRAEDLRDLFRRSIGVDVPLVALQTLALVGPGTRLGLRLAVAPRAVGGGAAKGAAPRSPTPGHRLAGGVGGCGGSDDRGPE